MPPQGCSPRRTQLLCSASTERHLRQGARALPPALHAAAAGSRMGRQSSPAAGRTRQRVNKGAPSVRGAFFHSSSPPSTGSTSLRFSGTLLEICRKTTGARSSGGGWTRAAGCTGSCKLPQHALGDLQLGGNQQNWSAGTCRNQQPNLAVVTNPTAATAGASSCHTVPATSAAAARATASPRGRCSRRTGCTRQGREATAAATGYSSSGGERLGGGGTAAEPTIAGPSAAPAAKQLQLHAPRLARVDVPGVVVLNCERKSKAAGKSVRGRPAAAAAAAQVAASARRQRQGG